MKFVNMHKGLVRFPAVGTFIVTIPSNKEFHGASLMMITTMSDNLFDHELLFVLLSNINWIDTMRIKHERMQIMNVRFDLLASNQVFNDVYRLFMSYHLIRSSMFGK